MFKLDLEKTEEPIANICCITRKAREFEKNIYFCFTDCAKPLAVWITINCGKFLKRWEYQATLSVSSEIWLQVKKQQLELDIEQQTGSKLGEEYIKVLYCHPAHLTCIQSTSCQMPVWMKCQLESRLPGEISITSDMQITPPLWQKWRRTKKPLDESERGEWKTWLKA